MVVILESTRKKNIKTTKNVIMQFQMLTNLKYYYIASIGEFVIPIEQITYISAATKYLLSLIHIWLDANMYNF